MGQLEERKSNQLIKASPTLVEKLSMLLGADNKLGPGGLNKLVKGIKFEELRDIRTTMYDLEYNIQSLRLQWQAADAEERLRIEALGHAAKAELAQLQAQVPPTLMELQQDDIAQGSDGSLPEQILKVFIIDLSSFYNVGKGISERQVEETAAMILETFPHHTLEQIASCFAEVKKGAFGPVYDRIDGGVIMEFLKKHTDRLRKKLQERNYGRHASLKPSSVRGGFYRLSDFKPKVTGPETEVPPSIGDVIK